MSENKLYWSPDVNITISGKEFEAFARLTELMDYPLSQLSTKQFIQLFGPATDAVRDVLIRMKDEGLLNEHEDAQVVEEIKD